MGVIVVCVLFGVIFGAVVYKYRHTRKQLTLTEGTCKILLQRPLENINFSLQGTVEEKNGNNILLKINSKERLWVSLLDGYRVIKGGGERLVDISLDDVIIGAQVSINHIGLSDTTENFLYADQLLTY